MSLFSKDELRNLLKESLMMYIALKDDPTIEYKAQAVIKQLDDSQIKYVITTKLKYQHLNILEFVESIIGEKEVV